MAYPPTVPPANRVDATPQATNHPKDHNDISRALTDIINELGNNPSGPSGTLQARVAANEVNKLARDGHQPMTNDLDMDGNSITNLNPIPPGPNSAVPREWAVDKFVDKAGDTMPGNLVVGTTPADGFGLLLQGDGYLAQAYNTVSVASVMLRRGLAANATGQVFIRFEKGTAPGTLISTIEIGASADRVLFTNLVVGTPSDYRMKENAGTIIDAADRVRRLARRAFRGRWRNHDGADEVDFLNAHDIADVAPYAVIGDKDGDDMQNVDYAGLVPLLVSALGDALDRITVLEAR